MIGLGRKGNRWGVVLGSNNFLLAICIVLMLYNLYVIVIYDGVYVGDMVNILVWRYISNTHENMANMSTGCGIAWRWI